MPIAVKIAAVTVCALVAMGTIFWIMRRNSKARSVGGGQGRRDKGSSHHMSKKSVGSVEVLSNPAPGPRLTPTPKNQQKALVPMTGEVTSPQDPLEVEKKPGFWMRTGSGAASSKPAVVPTAKNDSPHVVLVPESVEVHEEPTKTMEVASPEIPVSSPPVSERPINALAAPSESVPRPSASLARDQSSEPGQSPGSKNLSWTLAAESTPFVKPLVEDVARSSVPATLAATPTTSEAASPSAPSPEIEFPSALATAVNSLLTNALVASPPEPSTVPLVATREASETLSPVELELTEDPEPTLKKTANFAEIDEPTPAEIDEPTLMPAPVAAAAPAVSVAQAVDGPVATLEDEPRATSDVDESEIDDLIFYDDDDDSDSEEDEGLDNDEEIEFRDDVIRIHVRIDEHGVQQITTMDMSSGAQQWTDKPVKKTNGPKSKKKKKKSKKK